jgi:hypothetical protein
VIGESFVELRKPILKEFLHDLSDLLMDGLTLLLKEAVVNHFLSEGVFEYVFQFWLQ